MGVMSEWGWDDRPRQAPRRRGEPRSAVWGCVEQSFRPVGLS